MPPNVLLLVSDSQQARTVAPDSPCRTPNVDRIAATGTRFARCHAANPICSPSRATLMTGVLPHSHGVVHNTHTVEPFRTSLQDGLETWSERLADAGYDTGYVGKWHVERSGELDQFGFDEYELRGSEAFDEGFRTQREAAGLDPSPDRSPETLARARTVHQEGYGTKLLYGTHDEPQGTRASYTYSRGIEFVREHADRSEPWALTVSTGAPHDPFVAPERTYAEYDPTRIPLPANFDDRMQDKPDVYQRVPEVFSGLSRREFREALAHYFAFCTHLDEQVGRLLDALAETDQRDDTLVVFCSDHGDLLGAHRLFTHGYTAFEEVYRVPLVVDWPGVGREGAVCDEHVQLHDLGATIVDAADAGAFPPSANEAPRHPRSPPDAEGYESYSSTSLVPFLRGETPQDHRNEAYAEYDGDSFGLAQRVYWRGDEKYVLNMFGRDELYDLAADPAETTNLAGDPRYEERIEELAARIWEIARDTNDRNITENNYWMYRIAPVGPYPEAE